MIQFSLKLIVLASVTPPPAGFLLPVLTATVSVVSVFIAASRTHTMPHGLSPPASLPWVTILEVSSLPGPEAF